MPFPPIPVFLPAVRSRGPDRIGGCYFASFVLVRVHQRTIHHASSATQCLANRACRWTGCISGFCHSQTHRITLVSLQFTLMYHEQAPFDVPISSRLKMHGYSSWIFLMHGRPAFFNSQSANRLSTPVCVFIVAVIFLTQVSPRIVAWPFAEN